MDLTSHLLDDDALRQFIAKGYLLIQSDQSADFHQQVCTQLDQVLEREGNPGNNVLPRVPQIGQVFESAPVRGALTSLLGADYSMHPHRYCHVNRPGGQGQHWHKDDYVFDQNVRHHRFRWVMAFYYPQDVREDMGPTGVMPGRQYYNGISDSDPHQSTESEFKLCGPAGTVALVNFDVWHRATANTSADTRRMLKFQFVRMREPVGPSWNNEAADWQPVEGDAHPDLSSDVWQWLRGATPSSQSDAPASDDALSALDEANERRRLDAIYEVGRSGSAVVPELLAALRRQARGLSEARLPSTPADPQGGNPAELSAAHALAALGACAVEALVEALRDPDWRVRSAAADALGNMGYAAAAATPHLSRSLQDGQMWVRRNAAEALGTLAPSDEDTVAHLAEALADEDERVRRNAALALAKIGPPASSAVDALTPLLHDENRYVRFNGFLALQRIGTDRALQALWADVHTARWCPITTQETPY